MATPKIIINFANGAIAAPPTSTENVVGLVMNAIPGGFNFGTNNRLTNPDNLPVGLDGTVVKFIKNFFAEAGNGKELWVRTVPKTIGYDDMVTLHGKALVQGSADRVRVLIALPNPDAAYTPTIVDGMDGQVYATIAAAQLLGENQTNDRYAPIFTLLHAFAFAGATAVRDLTQGAQNRVGVIVADRPYEVMAAIAGRIARIPVQRKISRLKDRALKISESLILGQDVMTYSDIDLLNEKGYITTKTHVGKAGYFVTDDPLATATSDDYNAIVARRTIDKAYGIAYAVMLEELNDEIPINANGTIQSIFIKNWQQRILQALFLGMTQKGELSADASDPNDKGATCFIDDAQNVVSTNTINMSVGVRPFGYAEIININLGFAVNQIP